jgi:hypothetical protein
VTDASQSSQWVGILRDILTVARDTDTAFVLLHHASRATGEYRDSTHVGAAVDCILTMREDPLGAVRRLTARARWPLNDYAVRLAGDRFELVGRELTLDARILLHLQGDPGSSLRAVRAACGGRASDVDAALAELLQRSAVQNVGSDKAHKYVVGERNPKRDKDGHAETHPGHTPDTVSLGAPAGVRVPCVSPLGGHRHGHADGSDPTNCPDCGRTELTWLNGEWGCDDCERERLASVTR